MAEKVKAVVNSGLKKNYNPLFKNIGFSLLMWMAPLLKKY